MNKEAMKLGLEALINSVDLVVEDAYNAEKLYGNYPSRQAKVGGLKVLAEDHKQAIKALEEALKQEQGEPVATITITQEGSTRTIDNHFADCVRDWPNGEYKLYTTPQQRKPLTDEDFLDWYDNAIWGNEDFKDSCWMAFEAGWKAAHGIKE